MALAVDMVVAEESLAVTPVTEAGSETEAEAAGDTEAEAVAEPDEEAEAGSEKAAEAVAETEAEAASEVEAEAGAEAESDTEAEAAELEAEAETVAEVKSLLAGVLEEVLEGVLEGVLKGVLEGVLEGVVVGLVVEVWGSSVNSYTEIPLTLKKESWKASPLEATYSMHVDFPVLVAQPSCAPHLSGWLATEQKLMFKTNFRSANDWSMLQSLTWNMGIPHLEGSGLPAWMSAGATFQLQSLMCSEVHSVA